MSKSPPIQVASTAQAPSPARGILVAAKGGGVIFFGQLFSYASRFVFGIVVARTVGAAGFGLYNLTLNAQALVLGGATLGLHVGVVHFLPIALQKRDDSLVWGLLQTALALAGVAGTILALIMLGFADLLAENVFHEPALAPLLRIVSIAVPLTALGRVLTAVCRGTKQMQYQVYVDNIVFSIAKLGLTVLFLSVGLGVTGAVLAHVAAWIIEIPLLVYFVNRLFSLRRPLHTAQRNVGELLSFSLPMYLASLVGRLGGNLEVIILGMVGTVGWVGIFSAAARYQAVAILFLGALQTAIRPIISELHYRHQRDELRRLYQAITKWSLAFTLPFFLMATLFSKPLLAIFGEEFEAGSLPLIILFLGTLFNAGTGTCEPMISMTGHTRLKLINSVVSSALIIGLDLLLIPHWGIIGAAAAAGLSVALINVVQTIQVYVLLKIWPYTWHSVKPIIAGLVAFLATYLLNQLVPMLDLAYLLPKIGFLLLSYIAVIVLLGLSEEDQLVLRRVQRRFRVRPLAGR